MCGFASPSINIDQKEEKPSEASGRSKSNKAVQTMELYMQALEVY
jgi:hypothetical protein